MDFDYKDVPDECKVQLMAMWMRDGVSAWWAQTKAERERERW